jgi:hypothetical protein
MRKLAACLTLLAAWPLAAAAQVAVPPGYASSTLASG